jgi:hypothetical protein
MRKLRSYVARPLGTGRPFILLFVIKQEARVTLPLAIEQHRPFVGLSIARRKVRARDSPGVDEALSL